MAADSKQSATDLPTDDASRWDQLPMPSAEELSQLPPSRFQYDRQLPPRRRDLGFACCVSSRKNSGDAMTLQDGRQVWDTANLGWFDFQKRRWRTLALMRTIFNRTKGIETQTDKMEPSPEVDKMWDDVHKANAKEMREHCENEKGLLVKACQFMSMLSGTLPDPYPMEFGVLNEELPISSIQEVQRVILRDLGVRAGEIFDTLNPEPIASASIAQVHRARLRGTQEIVAVKIQHEGVDKVFLEDIGTLTTIANQVVYWAPTLDFRKFCHEWSESLPRELNFAEERRAQERAHAALRRYGNPCVLPRAHRRFTGRHVLVMEFIEAEPIMRLAEPEFCEKHNLDKYAILRSFLDAFGIMAFKDGLFHADPHAGNVRILVDKDAPGGAKPVLFDWGFFRELTDDERMGMAKVFHCMANYDMTGLFDVLAHLGYKFRPEIMTDEFRRDFIEKARSMMKDTVNKDTTRQEVLKAINDYKARIKKEETQGDAPQVNYSPMHFLEEWPRCVMFFLRMLQIVRGLCIKVDAVNMPVLDIFAQHAREALVEGSTKQSLVRSMGLFSGREALSRQSSPAGSALDLDLDADSGSQTPAKFAVSHAAALQDRVETRLAALASQKRIVGAQVAVVEGGKVVCDVSQGSLSSIDARPVESETRFPLLGAVPGLASLALVRTLRRMHGKWHSPPSALLRALHVPICSMWPQLSQGDSTVTLSDVLAHSAGVQDLFPASFGPKMLDDLAAVCEHFEKDVKLEGREPRYAFLLQAFLLAKLGDVVGGKDSLLHWLGSELTSLGLDIAAPAGRGGEASVCRDLPQLARVSMTEVSAGQERRKKNLEKKEEQDADNSGKPAEVAGSNGGKQSRSLLEAVAFDPLTFDPLQANSGAGACFRAGLSLGASARGLAMMLSNEELQADLEALNALEWKAQDPTAIGWLLTGGACSWTAGGQQVFDIRGGLLAKRDRGYGVACGLGPCVVHFPNLGQGGVTIAVMLNDVLRGREVAGELFKEVLSTYGYTPDWPEMPMRVMADAVQLSKSREAEPLLMAVGGLSGLSALQERLKGSTTSSTSPGSGWLQLLARVSCGCGAGSGRETGGSRLPLLQRLGQTCSATCGAGAPKT